MPLISTRAVASLKGFGFTAAASPKGQQAYTSPGSYTWMAPPGVKSVSVVAVGGGGPGLTNYTVGGGGGGLGYTNSISVNPGSNYTVVVGDRGYGGFPHGNNGGDSYFINTSTVKGGGGGTPFHVCYGFTPGGSGGSHAGTGGGNGGTGGPSYYSPTNRAGGGGAGGYSGNGGNGGWTDAAATSGSGGGGAGGAGTSAFNPGGGGGGVGILGQGSNGTAPGGGGSGGNNGGSPCGGGYGGGSAGWFPTNPHAGALRIIWGSGRSYPSTGTADV